MMGGLQRHPLGRDRLAIARIPHKDGVHHPLPVDPHRRPGQPAGLRTVLMGQLHLSRHVRVEGKGRHPLLGGGGGPFLEQARRDIGRDLHHGQEGRIPVGRERPADRLLPRRGGEIAAVATDVGLLAGGQLHRSYPGDHVLCPVERLAGQRPAGFVACVGEGQQVDVGQKGSFQGRPVQQRLLLSQVAGDEDRSVVLPLVALGGADGRDQPAGEAQPPAGGQGPADRHVGRLAFGHALALAPADGVGAGAGVRIAMGLPPALPPALRAGGGLGDGRHRRPPLAFAPADPVGDRSPLRRGLGLGAGGGLGVGIGL